MTVSLHMSCTCFHFLAECFIHQMLFPLHGSPAFLSPVALSFLLMNPSTMSHTCGSELFPELVFFGAVVASPYCVPPTETGTEVTFRSKILRMLANDDRLALGAGMRLQFHVWEVKKKRCCRGHTYVMLFMYVS